MRVSQELADELVSTAYALADAARVATLLHFRRADLAAETKETRRFDPVTAADRLSEERMRAILASRRPKDAILGEEFGPKAGTSGLTWVLDPIDGTQSFINGVPLFGTLIGLWKPDKSGQMRPWLGCINHPAMACRASASCWPMTIRWCGRVWCACSRMRRTSRSWARRPMAKRSLNWRASWSRTSS